MSHVTVSIGKGSGEDVFVFVLVLRFIFMFGWGVGKRLHVIVFHIAVSRHILTISASTVLANARSLFPVAVGFPTLILANARSLANEHSS